MGSISYTATRALVGGVTAGMVFNQDIDFVEAVRRTTPVGEQEFALAGNSESILQRIDVFWDVTLGHYLELDRDVIDQWIHSVANGEQFTIDFFGTLGAPLVPRTVSLVPGTVTETRVSRGRFPVFMGPPGLIHHGAFRIAFRVLQR